LPPRFRAAAHSEFMDKSQLEKLKNGESVVLRDILKKQNALLSQALLHGDYLLYLHKSVSLMDLRQILKVLRDKLPHILSIRYFSLFLFDKSSHKLTLACHNQPNLPDGLTLDLDDSPIMRDALENARYILEPEFKKSKYFGGRQRTIFRGDFMVCVPLMIENEIIGALNLNDNDKGFLGVGDLDFILNVTEFISLSISNALLFEKVEKLSITDPLTGLHNRQLMLNVLRREFARCMRYPAPLSLILLDVDHFKKVNDTHGHQKGDEVLVRLAEVLRQVCRGQDVAARYGGEEFVLILPQTPIRGAFQIAERIRNTMAAIPFRCQDREWHVTVSCGIAEFDRKTMKTEEQLVSVADKALYVAKGTGRNKTVFGNRDDSI
jgi:diguanylate cyclase (GGDEF)-like protein